MAITSDNKMIYIIGDIRGYTPAISSLISMMRYVRIVTLGVARDLSTEQLDYLHDEQSNSIAMLLFHIATVDKWYQNETFEGRFGFNDKESDFWKKGLLNVREESLLIKGNNFNYYKDLLNEVRKETFLQLQKRDDRWLKGDILIGGDECPMNNWFKWFHVFEDEINHRGQMSWLKKRLPK